jgi:FK506-binding protein 2
VSKALSAALVIVPVVLLAACGGSTDASSSDGTKFDSSYDRNQPYPFRLGAGQVIAGFDQGVVGMRVGGKRRLTIPPNLGYGNEARQGIPANSTLIFEIDLVSIAGK